VKQKRPKAATGMGEGRASSKGAGRGVEGRATLLDAGSFELTRRGWDSPKIDFLAAKMIYSEYEKKGITKWGAIRTICLKHLLGASRGKKLVRWVVQEVQRGSTQNAIRVAGNRTW